MFFRQYKIERSQDFYQVYDKHTKKIYTLPSKWQDLTENEKKYLKKNILIAKIFGFYAPGIVFLVYGLYNRYIIRIISVIMTGVSTSHKNYIPLILLYLVTGIYIIYNISRVAYNSKSYKCIKYIIEYRKQNEE